MADHLNTRRDSGQPGWLSGTIRIEADCVLTRDFLCRQDWQANVALRRLFDCSADGDMVWNGRSWY
ncbi:hypothetical protein N7533_011312 [Penicillium manginii]|jgi:hypothetical protein|uniref:uncharacterized protein n=1 Tax=Penicillium manginii TaxID=203109 RepID=UPI0025486D72|nr:uncharacterized protein N7533_011312 [Penicillium manginii]KAJ5741903.1 hypothetical protein N7533_011312 [Penicillium manginii]